MLCGLCNKCLWLPTSHMWLSEGTGRLDLFSGLWRTEALSWALCFILHEHSVYNSVCHRFSRYHTRASKRLRPRPHVIGYLNWALWLVNIWIPGTWLSENYIVHRPYIIAGLILSSLPLSSTLDIMDNDSLGHSMILYETHMYFIGINVSTLLISYRFGQHLEMTGTLLVLWWRSFNS